MYGYCANIHIRTFVDRKPVTRHVMYPHKHTGITDMHADGRRMSHFGMELMTIGL